MRGLGGGLTLSGRGDQPCPLDIVQESSEVDERIPVEFSNWRSRVGFVPESANLDIKTDIAATVCVQSTYWWVDAKSRVTAGPKPEGFGEESFHSFFQIQKAEQRFYKFGFCPSARTGSNKGSVTKRGCFDVGIFVDENGVRRLALTDRPFFVMFKKANVPEGSYKTMSII